MAPRSKPQRLHCCFLAILLVTFWSCQATAEAINAASQQQQDTTQNQHAQLQQENPYLNSRRAYEPRYEPDSHQADGSYRREDEDYPPPGFNSRQQPYGRYEDTYAGYRGRSYLPQYGYKQEPVQSVYNFRAVPGTEKATLGFISANSPATVAYTAKLACPSVTVPDAIGNIIGTGVMPTIAGRIAQMTFTITINADAGTVCGGQVQALDGITMVNNGVVDMTLSPTPLSTPPPSEALQITQMAADVLPVIGIYARDPSQDYKGGSLQLRIIVNTPEVGQPSDDASSSSRFTLTLLR